MVNLPAYVVVESTRESNYSENGKNDIKRLIVELTTGRKDPSIPELRMVCENIIRDADYLDPEQYSEVTFFFWNGTDSVGEIAAKASLIYYRNTNKVHCDFHHYCSSCG